MRAVMQPFGGDVPASTVITPSRRLERLQTREEVRGRTFEVRAGQALTLSLPESERLGPISGLNRPDLSTTVDLQQAHRLVTFRFAGRVDRELLIPLVGTEGPTPFCLKVVP